MQACITGAEMWGLPLPTVFLKLERAEQTWLTSLCLPAQAWGQNSNTAPAPATGPCYKSCASSLVQASNRITDEQNHLNLLGTRHLLEAAFCIGSFVWLPGTKSGRSWARSWACCLLSLGQVCRDRPAVTVARRDHDRQVSKHWWEWISMLPTCSTSSSPILPLTVGRSRPTSQGFPSTSLPYFCFPLFLSPSHSFSSKNIEALAPMPHL